MHGFDGLVEVDSCTVVRISSSQDEHLGLGITGALVEPLLQGQHHGSSPAIQLLRIVHGQGCHIVLSAAQYQSRRNLNNLLILL